MSKTLMITGLGDLAGLFLDIISREKNIKKIILAGRNLDAMTKRKNLALLTAIQLGFYPEIEIVKMDLMNTDEVASVLCKYRPDVILNTASLQSWRIITYLPKEIFKKLDEAKFGPWLPMHLTLVLKLMNAVKMSNIKTRVVNAAFPDAVGPALKTIDLAPFVGIGNVANVIPILRAAVSRKINKNVEDIEVALFAQHYFSHRIPTYGDAGGCPYSLTVYLDGEDITNTVNIDDVLMMTAKDFARTGGAFRQLITATSAVSVILPMLLDEEVITHAPSPNGLVGGYRVKLSYDKVDVHLPENISLEDVIKINEDGQVFDGIKKIGNGKVYFNPKEMKIMKDMLGYECLEMKVSESEYWSDELGKKYLAFAEQFFGAKTC